MREIKAIIRTERLPDVVHALQELPNMPGLTVSTVRGFGKRFGPGLIAYDQMEFTKLEAVVEDNATASVVETIVRHARTGGPGDGKIFVMPVLQAVQIREGVPEE